jgi:hypothetical protein
MGALALVIALGGCSLFGGGGGSTAATANDLQLTQIPWCDKPFIKFQDNGTVNQPVLTDWAQVRDQLNFTPYLPATMPKGACLVLAGGTIHDPIYGGRMSITYQLPSGIPVSFSEAPKRANLGDALQCQQSATDSQVTICIGALANTTVTIASRQSQGDVQKLFQSLQANVDWVPVVTPTPAASATATA